MNTCFPRAIRSTISPSTFLFKRRPRPPPLSNHLSRPCSSLYLPSISHKPRTPLFLRPPTHSTTLSELQKFHAWATNLIFYCGSHFEATDNGPGTDLLCRELRWLLEDAFEDSSMFSHLGFSQTPMFLKSKAESDDFSTNSNLGSSQNPRFLKSSADFEDSSVNSHLGTSQNPGFLKSNAESKEFSSNSLLGSSQNPSFLKSKKGLDGFSMSSYLGSSQKGRAIPLKAGLEELYCLWRERIEKRRPFQYIVGCEHWRDMVLSVEEGVLIPRPETELIVDMVGQVVLDDEGLGEGIWADLGTGSGAIGIGVERILGEEGRVVATDVSDVAVAVARFNVERYALQGKVEIRQGSWFEPLQDVKGKLAGLVSNPPYIPSHQISGLQAEVGRHEPRIALDGGENGMDDLLHLCEGSASVLKHGGFFAFETNGDEQSEFLLDIINKKSDNSFRDVKIESDYAGIRRFVTGFRR
ncbi:uncharacterized protein LOC131243857 [Magnolia sinica]|uniref:uncharacterized protein LOC131243857 n=1 Tax=Magnolia sinica TaxID=86752 RepID=UPI0026588ECF|nr:uncharacterized protein LOC131243857 [Magnolia sinica]